MTSPLLAGLASALAGATFFTGVGRGFDVLALLSDCAFGLGGVFCAIMAYVAAICRPFEAPRPW